MDAKYNHARAPAAIPKRHDGAAAHRPAPGSSSAPPAGQRCACGGTCPRCQSSGAVHLAGTRDEGTAPLSSQPDPLIRQFGRWVGYTTVGAIQFNPKEDPQPDSKPFFRWNVDFQTSLEVGTIVQKIESTWVAGNCDGTSFTGADGNATYWESWFVSQGQVQGRDSEFGAHDRWERNVCDVASFGSALCPVYPKPTWGEWTMVGTLYAYPKVDLGWSAGGHKMSGSRPSTASPPTQDLGRPMARREVGGAWNSCGSAMPTHHRL